MSLISLLNDVLAAKFPHQQTPEDYQRTLSAWLNGNQQPGQVNVTGKIPGFADSPMAQATQLGGGAGMDFGQRQSGGLYDQGPTGSARQLASPGDADFLRSLPPQIGMKLLTEQYQQSNSPEQQQLVRSLQMRGTVADMLAKAQSNPTQFDPVNISPQIAGAGVTPPPDTNIPPTPSMPAKPAGVSGFDYGGGVTPGGITPDLINRLKVKIVGAGGDPSFLDALGPKAPIKASAGDQFLHPETLQPIASVPKSVEYLEPRPAFNPATGKTGMWQAAKDGSPGKWVDVEQPPPQPEAPLSPERFQQQRDLQAAGKEPAVPWDNPVEVEVNDGQGGTTQVLAQQNKTTGQWVTADQSRAPLDPKGMRIIKSDVTGGGRVQGQIMRLMGSAKQATAEIKNLVELPITASSGWFAGRGQEKGLRAATKEVLTNVVTSQEVQDFNTSMIGMGRALAGLESGGMQPNQSLQDQFNGLALKEGDTNLTKMRKLATMRQDAENALDSAMTSPILGKEQKAYALKLMDELKAAVPWTPSDVTRLEHSNNPRATLGDFAKGAGLAAPPAAPAGVIRYDAQGRRIP